MGVRERSGGAAERRTGGREAARIKEEAREKERGGEFVVSLVARTHERKDGHPRCRAR